MTVKLKIMITRKLTILLVCITSQGMGEQIWLSFSSSPKTTNVMVPENIKPENGIALRTDISDPPEEGGGVVEDSPGEVNEKDIGAIHLSVLVSFGTMKEMTIDVSGESTISKTLPLCFDPKAKVFSSLEHFKVSSSSDLVNDKILKFSLVKFNCSSVIDDNLRIFDDKSSIIDTKTANVGVVLFIGILVAVMCVVLCLVIVKWKEAAVNCLRSRNQDGNDSIDPGLNNKLLHKKKLSSAANKEEAEKLKTEGNNLMNAEKYTEALNMYTKAIELDGKNPVFYCNRAASHNKMKDHHLAIEDCQRAIAMDPSCSKAYGRMGKANTSLEKYVEAVDNFKKALEMEPGNEDYKSNLQIAQDTLSTQGSSGINRGKNSTWGIPCDTKQSHNIPYQTTAYYTSTNYNIS